MNEESSQIPSLAITQISSTPTSPMQQKRNELEPYRQAPRNQKQHQQHERIDRPPTNVIVIRRPQVDDDSNNAQENVAKINGFSSLQPTTKPPPPPTATTPAAVTTNETILSYNQPRPPRSRSSSFSSISGGGFADPLSTSPFRLKPRHPISNMHSPSTSTEGTSDGVRGGINNGRKRRANTLSSLQPSITNNSDNNDGENRKTPPRPNRRRPVSRDNYDNDGEASTPSSEDSTPVHTPPVIYYNRSPRPATEGMSTVSFEPVHMSMQNLSLHSSNPQQNQNGSPFSAVSGQYNRRTGPSSFSAYGASPQAWSMQRTGSGSTSSSMYGASSFTPCSSARSSPRQVPVTVLTGNSKAVSGSPAASNSGSENNKTPPLFGVERMSFIDVSADEKDVEAAPYTGMLSPSSRSQGSNGWHTNSKTTNRKVHGLSPRSSHVPKVSLTPRTPLSLTPRSQDSRTQGRGPPRIPSPLETGSNDVLYQPKLDLDDDEDDDDIIDDKRDHYHGLLVAKVNTATNRTVNSDIDSFRHNDDAMGQKMDTLLLSFRAQKSVQNDAVYPSTGMSNSVSDNAHSKCSDTDVAALRHHHQGSRPFSLGKTPYCESSNSLAFSADGSIAASPSNPKEALKIELPSEINADQKVHRKSSLSIPTFPCDLSPSQPVKAADGNGVLENKKDQFADRNVMIDFKDKSVSLLNSIPSDDLQLIFHQSVNTVDHPDTYQHHFEESLSDSDNEFILADPISIAEEKQEKSVSSVANQIDRPSRRVRQRCDRPVDSEKTCVSSNLQNGNLTAIRSRASSRGSKEGAGLPVSSSPSTVDSNIPNRPSSSSLSAGTPYGDRSTSNASLFGMDIVLEEVSPQWTSKASATNLAQFLPSSVSASKLNKTGANGVSSGSLSRKDSDGGFGSSCSLSRRMSERSLGSLGLPLDALGSFHYNDDNSSGRDLTTPPTVMRSTALSPPLLQPRTIAESLPNSELNRKQE